LPDDVPVGEYRVPEAADDARHDGSLGAVGSFASVLYEFPVREGIFRQTERAEIRDGSRTPGDGCRVVRRLFTARRDFPVIHLTVRI
jgi:hypothetical protein